jgi:predicted TIM-barrel fold metal-dependent hydrolase
VIVDSHAHVDEVPALGWMDPASSLVALMDDAGVDQAIVMTYTELPGVNPHALEYLATQIGQYPDRLIGYVRSGVYRQDFLEDVAHDLAPERVMFGSSSPRMDIRLEIERVRWANLPEEARALILAGNARRVFRLGSSVPRA